MSGGLAASAAADGLEVEILHLTRGERGHPSKRPSEFGSQIEVEMLEAAAILGVRCEWAGLQAPLDEAEAGQAVARIVDRSQPRVMVTHWRGSWHPSHVRAHSAVMAAAATRDIAVLFGENCEDLDGFSAEYFVSVSNVYDRWLAAVRCYELFRMSEPRSDDARAAIPYWAYYTAAAKVRGLQADLELAEVVMLGAGTPPVELELRRSQFS
jgi:LmbE family N-acetylglucosaminyl deacetylase